MARPMDALHVHTDKCLASTDPKLSFPSRHDGPKRALALLLKHSGYEVTMEKQLDNNTQMRMDIVAKAPGGLTIAIDFSVASPFVITKYQTPGDAAKKREATKKAKYGDIIKAKGWIFRPAVMETFGGWSANGLALIKELVKLGSSSRGIQEKRRREVHQFLYCT